MELTAEYVRSILDYDPETGVFTWRCRPEKSPQWNGAWAGKRAGTRNSVTGYVQITVDGRRYYGHRLAWLYAHGAWPKGEVDHKDGDRAGNRIANLRPATKAQNMANAGPHRRNTSGARGVYWDAKWGRWYAQIMVNRRVFNLGRFDTLEEAAAARRAAEAKHLGEFAPQQRAA